MTPFCKSKGQKLSEHTSTRPVDIHVLQGSGYVRSGGERHETMPGAWTFMAPEHLHAVQATDLVFLLALFKRP